MNVSKDMFHFSVKRISIFEGHGEMNMGMIKNSLTLLLLFFFQRCSGLLILTTHVHMSYITGHATAKFNLAFLVFRKFGKTNAFGTRLKKGPTD